MKSSTTLAVAWEWFLILAGVIFYLLVFPHGIHGDGATRYDSMLGLVQHGTMRPMLYSYVGPLVSAPLLLLGALVKDGFWWISRFNTFVFFGMIAIFWAGLRREWQVADLRRMVLLFFCATMFPRHVTDYYSEVFSACAMAAAIFFYSRGKWWLPSALVLLSTWNSPGTAVGACLVLGFFFWQERRWRFLALVPLIFLGSMLENFLKFGAFFPSDYLAATGPKNILPYSGGPGFSYPLFFGVLSVLFSYGKGLLFFVPGIFVLLSRSLWRKGPMSVFLAASALYLAGLILVFSRWWWWSGDWFWGPRFYLYGSILAVFAFLEFGRLKEKSTRASFAVFFALLLSLWAGCQGVTWGQDFLEDCYRDNSNQFYFICHYVPEFSALWRPFIVWPAIHGRHLAFVIYFALVSFTLLWSPGKALCAAVLAFLRGEWKAKQAEGAWRL